MKKPAERLGNNTYLTMESASQGSYREKGSKFLSVALPVLTEVQCKEAISHVKKEHPKAAHHCFAYRLGIAGDQFRTYDDREPSGSAGRPILRQIDSSGMTNVVVIVTRYFGGTKLGIPGLINAYKTAAADAIRNGVIVEKEIRFLVKITFSYDDMPAVMKLLNQKSFQISEKEIGTSCFAVVSVPSGSEAEQRLIKSRNLKMEYL